MFILTHFGVDYKMKKIMCLCAKFVQEISAHRHIIFFCVAGRRGYRRDALGKMADRNIRGMAGSTIDKGASNSPLVCMIDYIM